MTWCCSAEALSACLQLKKAIESFLFQSKACLFDRLKRRAFDLNREATACVRSGHLASRQVGTWVMVAVYPLPESKKKYDIVLDWFWGRTRAREASSAVRHRLG